MVQRHIIEYKIKLVIGNLLGNIINSFRIITIRDTGILIVLNTNGKAQFIEITKIHIKTLSNYQKITHNNKQIYNTLKNF